MSNQDSEEEETQSPGGAPPETAAAPVKILVVGFRDNSVRSFLKAIRKLPHLRAQCIQGIALDRTSNHFFYAKIPGQTQPRVITRSYIRSRRRVFVVVESPASPLATGEFDGIGQWDEEVVSLTLDQIVRFFVDSTVPVTAISDDDEVRKLFEASPCQTVLGLEAGIKQVFGDPDSWNPSPPEIPTSHSVITKEEPIATDGVPEVVPFLYASEEIAVRRTFLSYLGFLPWHMGVSHDRKRRR